MQEAPVDVVDDLHVTGQQPLHQADWPLLQGLWQHCVVGESKHLHTRVASAAALLDAAGTHAVYVSERYTTQKVPADLSRYAEYAEHLEKTMGACYYRLAQSRRRR